MATIASNKAYWDGKYEWRDGGDECSRPWGGARQQWYWTLLPRIQTFLPTGTILEIACGYERWTQLLKESCHHLFIVDLLKRCITPFHARFASHPHIQYRL